MHSFRYFTPEKPLMIDDDDEQPDVTSGTIKATIVESKIGPTALQEPHHKIHAKTHGYLCSHTTNPVNRSTSHNIASPQ